MEEDNIDINFIERGEKKIPFVINSKCVMCDNQPKILIFHAFWVKPSVVYEEEINLDGVRTKVAKEVVNNSRQNLYCNECFVTYALKNKFPEMTMIVGNLKHMPKGKVTTEKITHAPEKKNCTRDMSEGEIINKAYVSGLPDHVKNQTDSDDYIKAKLDYKASMEAIDGTWFPESNKELLYNSPEEIVLATKEHVDLVLDYHKELSSKAIEYHEANRLEYENKQKLLEAMEEEE